MKKVQIQIPPSINFLELGLFKDDDGMIKYNMSVFKSMLEYNNLTINQFVQDDIEELLLSWYINHRQQGGEPDMCMEQLINAVSDQSRFDVELFYGAIIEPPTPEQIKELRQHTELTQRETASLLGLTNGRLIGNYEQGVKSPNPQTYTLWLLLTGQHPLLEIAKR